jgi:hypothetical protein
MKSEKNTEVTMKVNDVQAGLTPIGFLAHDSLSGANSRLKDIGAKISDNENTLSYWQLIFLQSRANGCLYEVEDLPHINWQWPKNTWFQDRLSHYLHALERSLARANGQRRLRRAPRVRPKAKGRRSP